VWDWHSLGNYLLSVLQWSRTQVLRTNGKCGFFFCLHTDLLVPRHVTRVQEMFVCMCRHAWMHFWKLCSSFDRLLENCDRHQMLSVILCIITCQTDFSFSWQLMSGWVSLEIFLIPPFQLSQSYQYEAAPAYSPCCLGGPLRFSCSLTFGVWSVHSSISTSQYTMY